MDVNEVAGSSVAAESRPTQRTKASSQHSTAHPERSAPRPHAPRLERRRALLRAMGEAA